MAPPTAAVELRDLLNCWREPYLCRVPSSQIIPDSSNRSHTGLSVDHVHFIASNILKQGFCPRKYQTPSYFSSNVHPASIPTPPASHHPGSESHHPASIPLSSTTLTKTPRRPHDIPVLVRGSPSCQLAVKALAEWNKILARESNFPKLDHALLTIDCREWFCSLGNGHFSQALNLFRHNNLSVQQASADLLNAPKRIFYGSCTSLRFLQGILSYLLSKM
jgi:hypothetical protein